MKSGAGRNTGTFIVKILNKRNSTWQGSITWVEEQQTQNFRSALELINLIDGVLEPAEEGQDEEKDRGRIE